MVSCRRYGPMTLVAVIPHQTVRSFEWQFLIVSWRIVAFLPSTVRHHLCTVTSEFHTSKREAICVRSWTVKWPEIFVAIARAASLGHCPHHRRANYKILFPGVYIYIYTHIIFILIALILQNLYPLFNAYLLPTHPVFQISTLYFHPAK